MGNLHVPNENGRDITRRVSSNNDGKGTVGTDLVVERRTRHVIRPDNASNDSGSFWFKNTVNGAMFCSFVLFSFGRCNNGSRSSAAHARDLSIVSNGSKSV